MATKTFTIRNALAGNFQRISEGSAGTEVFTSARWSVGTLGASNFGYLLAQGDQTTFGATAIPNTDVPGTATGDSFRTDVPISGSFASGNWTIAPRVAGAVSISTLDGRIRMRVFKSANADGSGATELTSGVLIGTTVTDLGSTAQASTITWAAPEIVLANEYLFFRTAWEITGAGGSASDGVRLIGGGASNIVSTDFEAGFSVSPTAGQARMSGNAPTAEAKIALTPAKAGLTLGSELEQEFGAFSNISGGGSAVDNGDGTFTITDDTISRALIPLSFLTDGAAYRIELEILSTTHPGLRSDWSDQFGQNLTGITGTYTYTASRSTYDNTFRFLDVETTGAGSTTFRLVSFREVLGFAWQSRIIGNTPTIEIGAFPIVGQSRQVGNVPGLAFAFIPGVGLSRVLGNTPSLTESEGGLWQTVGAATGTWGNVPGASGTWGNVPRAF